MPDLTAGLSHWIQQNPAARGDLVIAAWQARGSAKRFLAGIGDEDLRDIVLQLTPAEVADVAGDGTNPFLLDSKAALEASEASSYVAALEGRIRSLTKDRKQLADALAVQILR